jgi:transposase
MFFPEGQVRVHVYGHPVDMRKSYDGLYGLTRQELGQDPLNARLFVFINRRATQIKVLYWDRTGFCVWAKRLEQGDSCRTGAASQHGKWTGPDSSFCSKESKRKSSESATNIAVIAIPTV